MYKIFNDTQVKTFNSDNDLKLYLNEFNVEIDLEHDNKYKFVIYLSSSVGTVTNWNNRNVMVKYLSASYLYTDNIIAKYIIRYNNIINILNV